MRPKIIDGRCCYYCKYGVNERDRCGDYSQYCDKYNDIVYDTSVCEEFEI